MQNSFAFLAFCLCLAVTLAASPQQPSQQQKGSTSTGYTNRFDNINVDEILASKRLVGSYVKCLLNGKPCTQDGLELRRILPDAIATSCGKCNDKQKELALKAINKVKKEYPNEWKQLSDKWDPTGEALKKFEAAAGKH